MKNNKMKKSVSSLLAVFAVLVLAACSGKASQPDLADSLAECDSDVAPADSVATPAVPLHFGKTVWKNVLMVEKPSCATVEYDIRYADDGPEALVQSINAWVASQFDINVSVTPETLPQLVRQYAEQALKDDAAEIADFLDPDSEYSSEICYERSCKIRIEYTTPEYITMSAQTYMYSGGAHGGTMMDYATFRLSDGHKMGWDLLSGMSRAELNRAIRKGLMTYFEVKSDAELQDALLLDPSSPSSDIPLPDTPPFLTKQGVEVIYQQYEIASYAAGMPCCVVSLEPVL